MRLYDLEVASTFCPKKFVIHLIHYLANNLHPARTIRRTRVQMYILREIVPFHALSEGGEDSSGSNDGFYVHCE